MVSPFWLIRFQVEGVFLVRDVFMDGFIHRTFPVNFREQSCEMHAQRGRDKQHVIIRDAQRATFNLGNGAARGVVPAGKLQPNGKFLLRPAVALAQFDDLPSDQVQLFHFRSTSF